jgi:hypothetical protein
MKRLLFALTIVISSLSIGCRTDEQLKMDDVIFLSDEANNLAYEYHKLYFKYKDINPQKSDSFYKKYQEYELLRDKEMSIYDSLHLIKNQEKFDRYYKNKIK